MTEPTWIDSAVEAIVRDLRDRRGLGDEWDAIDPDTQSEIKETWAQIICKDMLS